MPLQCVYSGSTFPLLCSLCAYSSRVSTTVGHDRPMNASLSHSTGSRKWNKQRQSQVVLGTRWHPSLDCMIDWYARPGVECDSLVPVLKPARTRRCDDNKVFNTPHTWSTAAAAFMCTVSLEALPLVQKHKLWLVQRIESGGSVESRIRSRSLTFCLLTFLRYMQYQVASVTDWSAMTAHLLCPTAAITVSSPTVRSLGIKC